MCHDLPMSPKAGVAAAATALLALLPLAGCSGSPFTTSQSCIDWVWFETPADAAAEADAVALGRIVEQAGSTRYLDIPATTWTVDVDSWLLGDGDAEIEVTSLPRSCGDTGDVMAERQGETVVLFLRDDPAGWQTVTPLQGVVSPGPDDGMPNTWPDDAEG